MDIYIIGKQAAGKTRAAYAILKDFRPPHGKALSSRDVLYVDIIDGDLLDSLRASRCRAVVFDGCITTGQHLIDCVAAVAAYRKSINSDVLAIYVQQAEAVTPVGHPFSIGMDYGRASDRASIEYLPDVNATVERFPLTWDNTRQAFQAADLTNDGQVICSAVNVYAFNGTLKLGDGVRSKTFMLFELAAVNKLSGLHIAVDKMNTHFFETGRFEKRAFNVNSVKPATPSQVLEYLNAKYQYQLKNS